MHSLSALLHPAAVRLRGILLDWPLITATLIGLALGIMAAEQTASNIAADLTAENASGDGSL